MCFTTSNASDVPFKFDRKDMTYWPVVITAVLSIFGSLVIVCTYLLWANIRTTARLLLVFVSLADLVNGLGSLVGAVERFRDEACEVQALVTTASCLAFICWTTLLAAYLYNSVVRGNVRLSRPLKATFHVIGWGIPCAVVLSAFFLDALGDDKSAVTPGWCWIRREPDKPSDWSCERARLFWMLVTGKAWEVLSYIAMPVLYFLVKRHIRREALQANLKPTLKTQASLQAAEKVFVKFTAIPLAYVLLRIWGTIRFFFDVSHFNFTVMQKHGLETLYKALLYMQSVGDNGQGFVNFIIFCWFTNRIRGRLLRFFLVHVRCSYDDDGHSAQTQSNVAVTRVDEAEDKRLYSLPLNKSQSGENTPLLGRNAH